MFKLIRRRELICGIGALVVGGGPKRAAALISTPASIGLPDVKTKQLPSPVAGIRIVDSQIAQIATYLSRSVSPPYLFNHGVRTFLFASLAGRARREKFDEEILYLACILHDLGLTGQFEGDLPFEIQGAQAARQFLQHQGYDGSKTAIVWDGIAMHASLIGEYKQPEIALVGVGAGADVIGPDPSEINSGDIQRLVKAYPRLSFKKAFVETCTDVVRKHPQGAARNFMRDIGERYVSSYRPRNISDLITQSPFAE
ncbi:MAG: HD domain-containing protein [Acidobacteria bacterium]|nr:HD domain-containing protein [Acidobacteriota bacterium]